MKFTPIHRFVKKSSLPVFLGLFSFYVTCHGQQKMEEIKGYGKASYNVSDAGKYMKEWLIAGPIRISADTLAPDDAVQEKAFKQDLLTLMEVTPGQPLRLAGIGGRKLDWQQVSWKDDLVDLDSIYNKADFVYAYALAEINTPAATNVMLAVGSDDAIKVWLNGKLVHENWTARGAVKDNDLVPLQLVAGNNQLLLKVQDSKGAWGFVARLLDKSGFANQLVTAAENGYIDQIKLLLANGADINVPNENGITPIVAAKINGREEIIQLLLKKGARDKEVPSSEILTDNFYKKLKKKDYPGVAILVAEDGKVLYRKGFGYADIKNKIPVTPETKFRIGSVTKQFTAAAILRLQEKKLLSVNDHLSKFIPDFPRGDEVTIHQLLNHTSGIHSYTGREDFLERVTQTISPDSLIDIIKKDPYDFNPGEKMMYNNSGYFILGYIVSRISGKPYADYLRENFFEPLGMKNTGIHYAGIKLAQEAKGYLGKDGRYETALNWDMSWAGGAGAIYSTVDDLLKWNLALHNGKVIDKKSLNAAVTPAVLKNGAVPSMQYGYGLMLDKFRGDDIIGHSGGLHGFLTQLIYLPKEKLTVVMFTNTAEPEVNFDPKKIAETFLWSKLEKQSSYSELTVKPANLQVFVGRYEMANVGVMTITTEDNKLYAQLTGQAKYEIFPSSENEFFWKVVAARLKFVKDDKGQVNRAILLQNGQELKAERIVEVATIELDAALLDKYTGKFRLDKSTVVTIARENNHLFATPAGQKKLEMVAMSETDFLIKEINAKLSFIKDENGKFTHAKLTMQGTDTDLPRINE